MKSQNEIEKQYNALLKDVETNDYFTKIDLTYRVNCYVCPSGHVTKTQDVDAGVTPMWHECEVCKQSAQSTFYNDIVPFQKPTQEWYRPSLRQLLEMDSEAMVEHILDGGLMPRKIESAPSISIPIRAPEIRPYIETIEKSGREKRRERRKSELRNYKRR